MDDIAYQDHLAATSADADVQVSLVLTGDTEQRDLLMTNPNLTRRALAVMVDTLRFNPAVIPALLAHPAMTDDLRARVRTW